MALHKLCANEACWDLPRIFVANFAAALRVDLGVATNFCKQLIRFVQAVLEVSEEQAVIIVSKRLAINDIGAELSPGLLQVDEALECMDQNDAKVIRDEQHRKAAGRSSISNLLQSIGQNGVALTTADLPGRQRRKRSPRQHPVPFRVMKA